MAKGPDAFRTISEAAAEIGVAQHVLRFWETRFTFIKPMKRAGGRRFYRPRDIAVLTTIHRLLHADGLSIAEVQKLHRAGGLKSSASPVDETPVISAHPPGGASALRLCSGRRRAAIDELWSGRRYRAGDRTAARRLVSSA